MTTHTKKTVQMDENTQLTIEIRLDDECKNGFSEFAITWNIRETWHWRIAWGCLHDDIAKYAPEYKTIIDLHLSDVDGVPMYAVENGMYHMAKDAKVWLEYLRLEHINDADKKTLELIAKTNDKNMFYSRLLKNWVFEYRKTQAQAAIALLWYSSEWLKARKLEYSTKTIPSNWELEHIIELDTQAKKQGNVYGKCTTWKHTE